MKIPTGEEYTRLKRAFDNLSGNSSFSVILEYLKQRQKEDLKNIVILVDDLQIRWLQGEVQVLNEILKLSE